MPISNDDSPTNNDDSTDVKNDHEIIRKKKYVRKEKRETFKERVEERIKKATENDIFAIEDEIHEDEIEENNFELDPKISDIGVLSENIHKARTEGKRITFKERVAKRRKQPSSLSEIEYTNEEIIGEIEEYIVKNMVRAVDYRGQYFRRNLKKRLIRLRMKDFKEYFEYLKGSRKELEIFEHKLSIGVTRFFRDRDMWTEIENYLKYYVDNHEYTKIWSAGSSIGCEANTIAIILNERKYSSKIEILATDINEELLAQAEDRKYKDYHFNELSEQEINEYFVKSGKWFVLKELNTKITYEKLDLVHDSFPTDIDIIFCRNVLFYIDDLVTTKIISKFIDSLKSGGYLILGKSDMVPYNFTEVHPIDLEMKIYQKNTK